MVSVSFVASISPSMMHIEKGWVKAPIGHFLHFPDYRQSRKKWTAKGERKELGKPIKLTV